MKLDNWSKEELINKSFLQLINRDRFKNYLKKVPHKKFDPDMAVVIKIKLGEFDEGTAMCVVNDAVLKYCGLTFEEMYEFANENTEHMMDTAYSQKMWDVISDAIPELESEPTQRPIYIVTAHTAQEFYGGGTILLYPEKIYRAIGEHGPGMYYVIPSSIHEILMMPMNDCPMTAEEILAMQRSVNTNTNAVEPNEVLSQHLFKFDTATRKLQVVL